MPKRLPLCSQTVIPTPAELLDFFLNLAEADECCAWCQQIISALENLRVFKCGKAIADETP